MRTIWTFGLLLLLALAHPTFGAQDSTAFDQANKLFEQGKYSEAIAAYQGLFQQQKVSAALYFNLGNAYFKNGQAGQAILYYRLAQRLDPRDPDIRANLRFARENVASPAAKTAFWQRWFNLLTLNELSIGTAAVIWVWLLLLAVGQFRRDWSRGLRFYVRTSGVLTVSAVLLLSLMIQQRFGSSTAVVVTREAVVRYSPFEEAQSSFTLRDGAELTVLDRKDSWLQVSDPSNRIGWLPSKDVQVVPRG